MSTAPKRRRGDDEPIFCSALAVEKDTECVPTVLVTKLAEQSLNIRLAVHYTGHDHGYASGLSPLHNSGSIRIVILSLGTTQRQCC